MSHSKTILITGGTGLVGTAVTNLLLEKGYDVIVLTRMAKSSSNPAIRYAEWDPAAGKIDDASIMSADAIIHLAGANVAEKRWTKKRKQEIRDSRVQSGKLLVDSMKRQPNKIKTIVSASAIGWYGPDTKASGPFREDDPHATDFLGLTCKQWEDAIQPVTSLHKRLVIFRLGLVFSKDGGAYKEFRSPLKFRVAPILGKGEQVISWIHIHDVARLFVFALENDFISGVYNAVASETVTNRSLMKRIKQLKNIIAVSVPVPAIALKLGLGEMSIEVLKSATVNNRKISDAGFQFHYPSISAAIQQLENID